MEVNFDLLISGCNTRCRHCYVNGGPGKNMPLEDALLCMNKLDEIAAVLPHSSSFTLDNEPCNHPDIAFIIRAASSTGHIRYFHHGMTTGIALMGRKDRDAVVKAYLDGGWDEFGITLHGSPEHHDEIVRRKGAWQIAAEAAAYLKSRGARISVSLMLNRFFQQDAAEIDRALRCLEPEYICFVIPNYTPHPNMPGFEGYRASLADLRALSPWLPQWGQDGAALLRAAAQNTPGVAATLLEQGMLSLKDLFLQEQEELYLSVHQDCFLYLGNTGAETRRIGDLRSIGAAQAADEICLSPGNRDYGAFYDPESLPDQEKLVRALRTLPQDLLYADMASVLYRGLEAMQVPAERIISRR